MLDSNARRPQFDAFLFSLQSQERTMFLRDAQTRYEHLLISTDCSFIDCMENAWDEWREIGKLEDRFLYQPNDHTIKELMNNERRIGRQRNYYRAHHPEEYRQDSTRVFHRIPVTRPAEAGR